MSAKKKKTKLKKLTTIKRNLHKQWSALVRGRADFCCELCGIKKGDINRNGKKEKIDAHHLLVKEIKNSPLKYEILNGVSVCTFCHKFGIPSFHRDPIRTVTWLQQNRPERYNFVIQNADIKVDLENRKILEEIESRLANGLSLDLERLKLIEEQFPRKKKVKIEGSLFENLDDEESESEESSSSSEG